MPTWSSAQVRETEIDGARDRLRGLAEILARREAAGEAAGYDRLRAEREVMDLDADWAAARADRARAQAALAAFFAPIDRYRSARRGRAGARRTARRCPRSRSWCAHAESRFRSSAALQARNRLRAISRPCGRAAVRCPSRKSSPAPSPRTWAAATSAASSASTLTLPLFDRAKPEQALAQARARRPRRGWPLSRHRCARTIAALRAVVVERRQAAERYRASTPTSATQLERIAQVSYDAGERGILELLDAYRNSGAARAAPGALDAAARQAEIELEFVSGWEIR